MELTLFKKYTDSDNTPEAPAPMQNDPRIRTITLTPFDLLLMLLLLILFTASGSTTLPTGLLSLIIAAPLYAVFSYRIGNHFSFFLPLISVIACYVITHSIEKTIIPLLVTAMAYCILSAVNNPDGSPKTKAVVGCTVCALVFVAAELFIMSQITEVFTVKQLFESMKSYFETAKTDFIAAYSEILSKLPEQAEAIAPDMLSDYLDYVYYSFTVTLPATVTIYAMLVSYACASLLGPLSRLCHAGKMISKSTYNIKLSYISVIVYFISSLAMIFTSGAVSVGFQNISYILSPGLMLCGVKQIGALCESKNVPRALTNLAKAGTVIIALILGNLGTTVLIILGMYYTTKSFSSHPTDKF